MDSLGLPFMDYCVDTFAASFINLINEGYIRVEETTESSTLLRIHLFSKVNYQTRLIKRPSIEMQIGWLEEKIFEQYSIVNKDFRSLVHGTFMEIFNGNRELTNPGKFFIVELLKHQKLSVYDFKITHKRFSSTIIISKNKESKQLTWKPLNPSSYDTNAKLAKELKRIVQTHLNGFQRISD